jgi:hypothetical protein
MASSPLYSENNFIASPDSKGDDSGSRKSGYQNNSLMAQPSYSVYSVLNDDQFQQLIKQICTPTDELVSRESSPDKLSPSASIDCKTPETLGKKGARKHHSIVGGGKTIVFHSPQKK